MYSQEKADAICARMAEGESLRSVCRSQGMPSMSTVMRWLEADEKFREQYARAMDMRADVKFDELDDVSEDAVMAETAIKVAGLRLKADNIKWQLGKMAPKKYGEKLDLTHGGQLTVYSKVERTIVKGTAASNG
jgi:hypothetical protein